MYWNKIIWIIYCILGFFLFYWVLDAFISDNLDGIMFGAAAAVLYCMCGTLMLSKD